MRAVLSDQELMNLLSDDIGGGDLTTESLGIGLAPGHLEFSARYAMWVCGTEEAARMFALVGAEAEVLACSGAALTPGAPMLRVRGSAASLHLAWKTAQILIEWASGISSAAADVVAEARREGRPVPVACTRKNVPGTKHLSIKAVRAGGASMHRLGLSETLLVFPEHRIFLSEEPAELVARLHAREPEKKVVVEVGNLEDALRWAEAGAGVLQLEKFPPEQVHACRLELDRRGLRPVLAPAGGIRADNAAAYAAAGADMLITSAPYTAPPKDVQVDFHPG